MPFIVTAFPASFSKKYGPVTPPAQNPHHTVARCACNGFSWITRGFSAPQIQQFCVFTHQSSLKCASSLKMIFFEKLPTTFWFSNNQLNSRRYTWSVSLSSCVSWILLACRCRSFVRIRCMVLLEMSNCCEGWRIDVPGLSATLFTHCGNFVERPADTMTHG